MFCGLVLIFVSSPTFLYLELKNCFYKHISTVQMQNAIYFKNRLSNNRVQVFLASSWLTCMWYKLVPKKLQRDEGKTHHISQWFTLDCKLSSIKAYLNAKKKSERFTLSFSGWTKLLQIILRELTSITRNFFSRKTANNLIFSTSNLFRQITTHVLRDNGSKQTFIFTINLSNKEKQLNRYSSISEGLWMISYWCKSTRRHFVFVASSVITASICISPTLSEWLGRFTEHPNLDKIRSFCFPPSNLDAGAKPAEVSNRSSEWFQHWKKLSR